MVDIAVEKRNDRHGLGGGFCRHRCMTRVMWRFNDIVDMYTCKKDPDIYMMGNGWLRLMGTRVRGKQFNITWD